MPVYTYRRQDGTTFEYRQRFLDDPLTVDPETGQPVVRVVQPAGIIFKGSGFYVNDSKNASKKSLNGSSSHSSGEASAHDSGSKSETPAVKAEAAAD